MYRDTSRKAYYEEVLPKLGQKQESVYQAFRVHGDMSNAECANKLCCPINCITPRSNELVKLGLLEAKEKRPCNITKRMVIIWGITWKPQEEIKDNQLTFF